jgi:hypothetical protein
MAGPVESKWNPNPGNQINEVEPVHVSSHQCSTHIENEPIGSRVFQISDPLVNEVKEKSNGVTDEKKKPVRFASQCENCGFQNEEERRNGFRTWTQSEYMVLEKWSLDYMVKYQIALVCAEYYWSCYRWIGIPASLCAFLTAPGQWLYFTENISQRAKTIFSVVLGFLGLMGGCLSFLMITLKLAEKAQQYHEHADLYFRLYQKLERELDRGWHDLSFLHFCRLVEMLEMQQRETLMIPPPKLKKKFQKMEEAILNERISLNAYEMKTIYRARKLRRSIINGRTLSRSPEDEKNGGGLPQRIRDRLVAYESSPDLTHRKRIDEQV